VRASEVQRAVKVIHDRFELSEEAVLREQHPATVTGQLKVLGGEGAS
jgi:hypothetical protein